MFGIWQKKAIRILLFEFEIKKRIEINQIGPIA